MFRQMIPLNMQLSIHVHGFFHVRVNLRPDNKNQMIIDSFEQVKLKEGNYVISSLDVLSDISKLYKISKEHKIEITNISINETSLEEVFIHLINEDSKSTQEVQEND